MINSISFSVHQFSDLGNAPFDIKDYSKLKFGSDIVARKFGYELAEDFAEKYLEALLANSCVVIPSPYNYIENAATVMTRHFVNRLNQILVEQKGEPVQYSTIHRKCAYMHDYGFLTKEQRFGLLDNDEFYLYYRDFYKDKTLIFIDDVKITGTHEDKLKEILNNYSIFNNQIFLYYARYYGDNASIESRINFAAIKNIKNYSQLLGEESNYHLIIRPIKYILGLEQLDEVRHFLSSCGSIFIEKLYYAILAEGYYKIPAYQKNFELISNEFKQIK